MLTLTRWERVFSIEFFAASGTAITRPEGSDHAPTMTTLLKVVQALDAKRVIDSDAWIDLVAHRRRTKRGQSIAAR
ncbi:MAG: hypothetical protein LC748_14715 [Thermomicrobia bacterium]|nr:hypothetical protein [Thermomicrobia bacterium]